MTQTFSARVLGLVALMLFPLTHAALGQEKQPKTEGAKIFQVVKEVWATPFKPQGNTGTCWCFSTTSFLESEAHRLGRGDFELSQIHTVYYAYIEKAFRRVRSHGNNPFRSGGLAHDVLYAVGKYGAVPRSVYPGLSAGTVMPDHRELDKVLAGMLGGVVAAGDMTPLSGYWVDGQFHGQWFDAFRGILNAYLGKPPEMFSFKGRDISPQQFTREILNLPLDDYVEVTSYSQLPFYAADELNLPDNWMHYSRFYNVPLEDFVRVAEHAIENGFSMVFDLHWTEEEGKSTKGYALGHDEATGTLITQDQRDSFLESWRTEDVHLEHAIGMARDAEGKKYYKAKDSNGSLDDPKWPFHNLEYFSEGFLRSRVLSILVHKDGLPANVRVKLGIR
jgi:bleomycin hydrolase